MLTSLSFIFLVGLAMAAICQRIRLPRIIGMLLTGICLALMCWIFWIRPFFRFRQSCVRWHSSSFW